jgi:D-3-phosphoglycerate dehydrogenase / 2-oxoglutarate reductase
LIKILNAEPVNYSGKARSILESIGELHECTLTRNDLIRCLKEFDVLIARLGFQVDREVIDAGERLKVIVTATTGLDHIDVSHSENRGIKVLSLRGDTEFLTSVHATAEHTVALILALLRQVPKAATDVQGGRWRRDQFKGCELHNKTVGIVGYGRIGRIVARFLKAFDARILISDPNVNADSLDSDITIVPQSQLLQESDLVSLHVNLCSETIGLFGQKQFTEMKREAWFINTSRGALVDESALLAALRSGRLSGAALDVVGEENPDGMKDHPLIVYAREHNNLIITPHIGGCTAESMEKTEVYMAEKLRAYLLNI